MCGAGMVYIHTVYRKARLLVQPIALYSLSTAGLHCYTTCSACKNRLIHNHHHHHPHSVASLYKEDRHVKKKGLLGKLAGHIGNKIKAAEEKVLGPKHATHPKKILLNPAHRLGRANWEIEEFAAEWIQAVARSKCCRIFILRQVSEVTSHWTALCVSDKPHSPPTPPSPHSSPPSPPAPPSVRVRYGDGDRELLAPMHVAGATERADRPTVL